MTATSGAAKLEASVGDFVFNEAADYEVTIGVPTGVEVFTSGTETERNQTRTDRRSPAARFVTSRFSPDAVCAANTPRSRESTSDRSISPSTNALGNAR